MSRGQFLHARMLTAGAALAALGACADFDPDLRDLASSFDTSAAASSASARPEPDARGVITYPNYQVVVARQGDTIRTISQRLGLQSETLARYNGLDADQPLRPGEIVALPAELRVGGGGLDVTAVAGAALDRADAGAAATVTTTTLAPTPAAAPQPAPTPEPEPVRHQVKRGETVFAISRLYGVSVRAIAEWNALDSEFTVREGQYLLIPQDGRSAPAASRVSASTPGAGTLAPTPPSAATPLPSVTPAAPLPASATPAAPNLGGSSIESEARFLQPVPGSIIRAYAPGTNEGIDIGAPSGTAVRAADAGKVAAITTNTAGIAIVVLKHNDGLLTVYTNISDLSVAKDDQVSRGETLGKVAPGSPSFVHFEVRRGLQSVDPTDYLP